MRKAADKIALQRVLSKVRKCVNEFEKLADSNDEAVLSPENEGRMLAGLTKYRQAYKDMFNVAADFDGED